MADHTGDITCIASSSSSSTNTGPVFDVFLNHRGPDTKKGLASHIYRRLIVRGLRVFLDQPELRKGENFEHQIEEAIRTASVHVAIFSPTYAQSTWCLKELALMVESKSTIIPVFHDVDPSELRWTQSGDGEFAGVQSILRWILPQSILSWILPQSIVRWIFPSLQGEKGRYARDLHMLQKKTTLDPHTNKKKPRYESSVMERWRNALSVVSNNSGFVINAYNGDEGQLVDAVVEEVWRKVSKTPLHVAKYPTGLDEKIEHVEKIVQLQQQSQKTRVVGIVGLGGVGKTTLAKEFFNRHRSNYDRCCFVSDVRETAAKSSLSSLQAALLKDLAYLNEQISNTDEGIGKLQKHLSSCPPCLIVLDDVDHIDQLDALFSPVKDTIQSSSLILVTSRNRDVLTSSGIVDGSIYKQTGLNQQHSKDLFCLHAFDQSYPVTGFEQLVEDFLNFCDALPLSLKVIGAAIRGKDSEFWKKQLDRIRRILPTDIHSKLKISYDGLDKEEQEIFLDVACFLIGENRDPAIAIWNGSGWDGWLGLHNLESRCLLEIDSEECIRMHDHLRDLGRDVAEKEHPLRLSRPNVNLFRTLSPLSAVRGINMDYGNGSFFENVAGNCNLSRLELVRGEGSSVKSLFSAGGLQQLIYLRWDNCPISSISFTGRTRNLRVLCIRGGKFKRLWIPHEHEAPLQLTQLHINALLEVPESIGKLNQLEKIVLENGYFTTLPNEFSDMHSLKHLKFSWCNILERLPDSLGQLTGLQSLNLEGCSSLQGLPDWVGQLTGLQSLNLECCYSLQGLPDSVGQLTGLQSLNLKRCFSLQGLSDSVGQLTGLQSLNLEGCYSLQGLPDSVGQLTGLQSLNLDSCYSLQGLPDSVGQLTSLQSLNLEDCSSLQGLPDSVGQLTGLHSLNLEGCSELSDSVKQLGWLPHLQPQPLRPLLHMVKVMRQMLLLLLQQNELLPLPQPMQPQQERQLHQWQLQERQLQLRQEWQRQQWWLQEQQLQERQLQQLRQLQERQRQERQLQERQLQERQERQLQERQERQLQERQLWQLQLQQRLALRLALQLQWQPQQQQWRQQQQQWLQLRQQQQQQLQRLQRLQGRQRRRQRRQQLQQRRQQRQKQLQQLQHQLLQQLELHRQTQIELQQEALKQLQTQMELQQQTLVPFADAAVHRLPDCRPPFTDFHTLDL